MVKRMEYCRWEVAHHMQTEPQEFPFTEAQFMYRASELAEKWEVASEEMACSVLDILTNRGGKVGRFSW